MDSHLCAYRLGPLLKQYPKTSLCYHAQRHMQAAPPSSGLLRSLSLSRHQQAPLQTERFRRRFQTYHRPSADHELSPLHDSSTKFDSTNTHNSRRELDNGTQASGRRYRPPVKRFAVLGGGVSGLATAYYLKSIDPLAKITIYEASDRVGGWISTEQVDTSDGRLMFEMGPRTLLPQRVSSVAAIQMVR
jgi:NAD(P)-binding Rossmann-like domain